MARYSLGITTPAAAAGAAYANLISAAGERLYVREIGLFLNAATASSIGLIRPATVGTATSPVAGQAVDAADAAATGTVGTAWSAAGTIGSNYLRKITLPAAIGNGIIWTFGERDLVVPVSSCLFLWNFGAAAGSVLNGYIVWDE